MEKAKRAFKKMLRSIQRRNERIARRQSRQGEFSVYQLANVARMQQRLVVMGK